MRRSWDQIRWARMSMGYLFFIWFLVCCLESIGRGFFWVYEPPQKMAQLVRPSSWIILRPFLSLFFLLLKFFSPKKERKNERTRRRRRRGYWPTSDPIQIEQKPNPTLLLQFVWSLLSISWFPLMSSSSCMFCCCRRCNSSTTTTYRRPSVRFCRLPSTCSLLKTRPISLSLSLSLVCLFT